MAHQPGDKTIHVHREDVARGAREAGIGLGDIMMFHSSLSSMGTVVGGPNTVIDGFLDAVGPEGTLAAPTLWWNGSQDLADWDFDNSPSYPGLITETLRQRPDSIRSNNPTHSVSAIGARAAELTANHGDWGERPCMYGDKAFAAASPWERLYQWNAQYCFLGVDFTYNTMGHYCQSVLIEWALAQALQGAESLDGFLRWTEQPLVKFAECGLVLLLGAHLCGGLRLLLIEFLPWHDHQKSLLAIAGGASVVIGLAFALNVV